LGLWSMAITLFAGAGLALCVPVSQTTTNLEKDIERRVQK
jgi:hypothetical protein